ncbi:MAG: HEPN domain-containing protein [Anaerolineae bacterium]
MRRGPLAEGRRWLEQAQEDLHWAQLLAREGAYHLACFHAQQVTEKALKAFLYAQGEEMVIGHSVARLCARAAGYQPVFAEKAREWSILDGYYVLTRYPNSLPDDIPSRVYTRRAADEAVALAADAVAFVQAQLRQQP